MSPAVNVDLEEVPYAILEAVKARILAGRRRLQTPPPSTRPRPQFRKFGASAKAWRRPQPAATLLPTGYSYGTLWWIIRNEPITNNGYVVNGGDLLAADIVPGLVQTGIRRRSLLFCGDGSKSIEVEHGQQPQQLIPTASSSAFLVAASAGRADRANTVLLPVGDGVFLLLFLASNAYTAINIPIPQAGIETILSPAYPDGSGFSRNLLQFSKATQKSVVRRCFVCSNTSIREIGFPAAFTDLLDEALAPETVEVQQRVLCGYYGVASVYANTTLPEYQGYAPSGNDGYAGIAAVTPEVFADAVDALPAWQARIGSMIRPIPADIQWAVPLPGGSFQTAEAAFNGASEWKYAIWSIPGEQPATPLDPARYEEDPDATLTMSTSRPILIVPGFIPNVGYVSRSDDVWDWNDPDYCRGICLALGFSDADLTP